MPFCLVRLFWANKINERRAAAGEVFQSSIVNCVWPNWSQPALFAGGCAWPSYVFYTLPIFSIANKAKETNAATNDPTTRRSAI